MNVFPSKVDIFQAKLSSIIIIRNAYNHACCVPSVREGDDGIARVCGKNKGLSPFNYFSGGHQSPIPRY
jgi:hypothetical protein